MTCAYCDHFQSALFKAQWFTCGHVIAFSPNKLIKKIAVLSKSNTGESKLRTRQCGAPALVGVQMVLRKSGQATWCSDLGGRGGRRTETNWRSGATGGGMLPLLPTTQIQTSTHPLRFCSSLVCFSFVQVLSIINQSFGFNITMRSFVTLIDMFVEISSYCSHSINLLQSNYRNYTAED